MGIVLNPYRYVVPGCTGFSEDYTTNSGWTQSGSGEINVDSTVADKLSFATTTNTSAYVYKSIGCTLSDTLWSFDFDYYYTSRISYPNVGIFTLAAGILDPLVTASDQDCLAYCFGGKGASEDIELYTKEGANARIQNAAGAILITTTTQYYCTVSRDSATQSTYSVFSDSGRTTHVSISPEVATIDSAIITLTHLHHANDPQSAISRGMTGNIDNTVQTV